MIVTCIWADLIIWMVYMKGQVANFESRNGFWCDFERWTNYWREWILKDGQRSLRSSKAISNQGRSNGVEQRFVISKFSCILFRSFHCYFLTIVAVIPKSLKQSYLNNYFVNPLTRWQFSWIVQKTSNKATPNRVTSNSVFCNL